MTIYNLLFLLIANVLLNLLEGDQCAYMSEHQADPLPDLAIPLNNPLVSAEDNGMFV